MMPNLLEKKIYSFCSCYFTLFLFNIPQVLAFVLMLLRARWAFFRRQYALHSLIGIDFQRRGLQSFTAGRKLLLLYVPRRLEPHATLTACVIQGHAPQPVYVTSGPYTVCKIFTIGSWQLLTIANRIAPVRAGL